MVQNWHESTRAILSNEIMNQRASHSNAIEGNNNWKRKFNDRFINWKLQNSFAISSLSQGTIPVAREKVSRQWEDIYIAEDSVAKQITVKERGRQSYLELSWATLSRNNDLLFS